jgi:uroporphyrinogen decarboxylase
MLLVSREGGVTAGRKTTAMGPKENLLRAIGHEDPAYVPRANEGVMAGIQYAGNFRVASWTDAWGTRWETTREDMVPFPRDNPLPDLRRVDDFQVPDPHALFDADESLPDQIARIPDRESKLVFGQQTYFLFERAWALTGMESFMAAFHEHPDELRELLRRITDYNVAAFERYIELGVDGVGFSEDLGTQRALMISPEQFRAFLLPEYARAFAPLKQAGKLINFHSCGCVQDIVAELIDVGVDILNPVQARANDLAALKSMARAKLALMGGIDTQHVLMLGTPEEVEAEVRRVLAILGPGGGYIIGPDQGMPFPPENIEALWGAAERWGRYPLEDTPAPAAKPDPARLTPSHCPGHQR